MDVPAARNLLASLGEDHGLLGYSGRFPDAHSARLIELGELSLGGNGRAGKGRTGYVLVETYQNVIRHRAPMDGEPGGAASMFIFRSGPSGQLVFTSNPVGNEQADGLGRVLAELRDCSAAELKKRFMAKIQEGGMPGKRGAGLGLIEMMRRAGGRPQWSFVPFGDAHQLFSFVLEFGIPAGAARRRPGGDQPLLELALRDKLLLFHVGRWGREGQAGGMEKVLADLARAEVPAINGVAEERDRWWRIVAAGAVPLLAAAGPVLFALHQRERTTITVGGEVDQAAAAQLHGLVQGTALTTSFGDGSASGRVLALVHLPW